MRINPKKIMREPKIEDIIIVFLLSLSQLDLLLDILYWLEKNIVFIYFEVYM